MKLKITSKMAVVALSFVLASCTQHLVTDAATRAEVHEELEARQALFTQGDVFDVFSQPLTVEEREAMEFLYASMASVDLGDYEGTYFLENVRMALKARREMAWGKDVPENLFMHFVLPLRVNNERLDDFRTTYYEELKHRVAGMSLHDAALEVNHWCHEHVAYVPSDARTSSPMATMRNAEGRCGEESTFTVTAMRTIGIPARQVYTPRWPHTDSNHAWVEVWVDGKWQFLGACEPEPRLNIAWFNQPATRALLVHTRVTGNYKGDEDVIQRSKNFTEINVIDTYAPVRRSLIKVVDTAGQPVAGAKVEFKIYNYAEFCSVVTLKANEQGEAVLHSGLGDMLVWASKDGKFGLGKLDSEALTVTLSHQDGDIFGFEEDITPPVQGDIPVHATPEEVAHNQVRFAREDSIRIAYMHTFFHQSSFTQEPYAGYTAREQALLIEARGNGQVVKAFIDGTQGAERERALALLEVLPKKDLHDTSLEVLQDALEACQAEALTPIYIQYVLNPRITSEFLQPYRTQIRQVLTADLGATPTPTDLVQWVKAHISLVDEYNPIALQGTPAGVLRLRMTDTRSRNRFFVAACRSFGIPAHMLTITGQPQYYRDGQWIEVALDGAVSETVLKKGTLKTAYDKNKIKTIPAPLYSAHYTIARIDNGVAHTIDVHSGRQVDLESLNQDMLAQEYELDEGYYLLTTGHRMASGKVLTKCRTFVIKEHEETPVTLEIRDAKDDIAVIGSMDPEKLYLPAGADAPKSILSTTGRGYFLIAVMGANDEPTNHALLGLQGITDVLNAWGRPFVVLNASAADAAKFAQFKAEKLQAIQQLHYGVDINDQVRAMLCAGCHSTAKTLPVIALCDSFGRIVYFSQGYNTSVGDQLKNVIHKL